MSSRGPAKNKKRRADGEGGGGDKKKPATEKKEYKGGKEGKGGGKEDLSNKASSKFRISINEIKNAERRKQAYEMLKRAKSKKKMQERRVRKAEREALGDAAPKPFIKSIDAMREPEQSIVDPNDEEVAEDESMDEFAKYFNGLPPKVAITTRQHPTQASREFVCNMQDLIPGLTYYRRREFPLKKIIKFLKNKEYTDLVVVSENRKKVDGLMIIHLPDGPTATFKLTSLEYPEDIEDRGIMSSHNPELILNNFTTRMGHGVARMFASMFPQVPEFTGRRIITFHNQRDFIFVRQHRYIFEPDSKDKLKPRIQELGPRMTLKLQRLQHGTFDTMEGEFEWFGTNKMYQSSKKFYM